jgi:large subunit ribosomal protein L13
MVTIDADGAVVGRLGARVAKLLLANQHVEIINADKAVMAGSLSAAKEKYLSRRSQKNKRTPEDSPVWPRAPHLLLRRMVRGMLPHKSKRGRDAYHRLKVVVGAPEGAKAQKIPEASDEKKRATFTLTELCAELGKHMRKE